MDLSYGGRNLIFQLVGGENGIQGCIATVVFRCISTERQNATRKIRRVFYSSRQYQGPRPHSERICRGIKGSSPTPRWLCAKPSHTIALRLRRRLPLHASSHPNRIHTRNNAAIMMKLSQILAALVVIACVTQGAVADHHHAPPAHPPPQPLAEPGKAIVVEHRAPSVLAIDISLSLYIYVHLRDPPAAAGPPLAAG